MSGADRGRLGGAHSYLLRNFPPYRASLIILPAALVLAAAGFWLRDPPFVIPHPAPPQAGVPAGAPAAPAGARTGDNLTCSTSRNNAPPEAASAAMAACQRIIGNTASGNGGMPAWQAYDGEALASMALNRPDDAYAELQHAIEIAPDVARPLALRALLNNNLGRYAGGITDANSALALDAGSIEAKLARAVGEANTGDPQDARRDADAAVNANPGDLFAHLIRGEAEDGLRQWDQAQHDTGAYLKAFPRTAAALYWHGVAEEHLQGGLPTAVAELTQSVQLDPRFANPHRELGLIAFRGGDWNEALRQESQALAIDPDNAGAYTARSGAEIRLAQFKAARDDATQAIRHGAAGPMLVAAQQNLGMAAMQLGDYADAVTALQAAHDADPDNAHLAGMLDQARRHAP